MEPISGRIVQQALFDAKVIPELCRRVVIDIPLDDAIKVYYESYGSKEVLDVIQPYLQNAIEINTGQGKEEEKETA